ncbi:MAG: F0F1 ATP synthase subunit gamma [Alphaproteobacteria bacterium]|nr:F0F1 ATP synthase subunit gamma [Alphaproteobacteria bacterium]
MASLKALKNRIKSVKSTQKITKAMKMVAASKLRRAREQAEATRPYAERMERMLRSLATSFLGNENAPKLLVGNGNNKTHLIVVMTSDRGLCGAFNSSILRETRKTIRALQGEGKTVKLLCVGRKGFDLLQREYAPLLLGRVEEVSGKKTLSYAEGALLADRITELFTKGEVDVISILFNRFRSAISQIPTLQQIIPLQMEEATAVSGEALPAYDYEPDEEEILKELLPKNLAMQSYRALLESAASEQGARMTAMDNATRNSGDMIKKLNLVYNRSRQAAITKELIEIISGAEAV